MGCENAFCPGADNCYFAEYIENPRDLRELNHAWNKFSGQCADMANQEPKFLSKKAELEAKEGSK